MPFPILLSVNDWRKKSYQDKQVEGLLREVYDSKTIYERFDKLVSLLDYCDARQGENLYRELASSIVEVIGHIIDDTDERAIREKIEARKIINNYDPYYMPWVRPNSGDISNDPLDLYKRNNDKTPDELKNIFNDFYAQLRSSNNLLKLGGRNSDSNSAPWAYRSEVEEKAYGKEEIEAFRVIPNHGKLLKLEISHKKDDRRLSFGYLSTEKLSIKAYDTFLQKPEDYPQTAIYTVHVNGGMFVGRSLAPQRTFLFDPEAILHPSYGDHYSGMPLFMAGQIKVIDGAVKIIDSASGHFVPDYNQTIQSTVFFKNEGIVNNHTLLPYYRPQKGEDEREYTTIKCSELEGTLRDYCTLQRLDLRQITADNLKKNHPEIYTKITLQENINNELSIWKSASSVWLDRPSEQIINLTNTVEQFSKQGDYKEPQYTLNLLNNINTKIQAWYDYHHMSGKSSRRQDAVEQLQQRVLQQIIYYQSYLFLRNHFADVKNTSTIPNNYRDIVVNFLNYKADLQTTINEFKEASSSYNGPSFFSEKNANPESIAKLKAFHSLFKTPLQSLSSELLQEISVQLLELNNSNYSVLDTEATVSK